MSGDVMRSVFVLRHRLVAIFSIFWGLSLFAGGDFARIMNEASKMNEADRAVFLEAERAKIEESLRSGSSSSSSSVSSSSSSSSSSNSLVSSSSSSSSSTSSSSSSSSSSSYSAPAHFPQCLGSWCRLLPLIYHPC